MQSVTSLSLGQGPLRFSVDPIGGGRIIEFSLQGKNAVHMNGTVTGSTFWPSPQDAWGWPPPTTLDQDPYEVLVADGRKLTLQSGICRQTGLQLIKQFEFKGVCLQANYTMVNASAAALQYAPWEITRVGGGITFYSSAESPLSQSSGATQRQQQCVWHEYDVLGQKSANQKIFGNRSDGWLANANENLLLVKQFEQVPADRVAPGEAEVEIYGHGDPENPYVEIEQQGCYQVIAPGCSVVWSVKWMLDQLDRADKLDPTSLLKRVQQLLDKARAS